MESWADLFLELIGAATCIIGAGSLLLEAGIESYRRVRMRAMKASVGLGRKDVGLAELGVKED